MPGVTGQGVTGQALVIVVARYSITIVVMNIMTKCVLCLLFNTIYTGGKL